MANEYLKRTPTSTGNRKTWTWSGWVKKNELSISFGRLFEVGADTSNRSYFTFRDGDELEFVHRDSATNTDQIISDLEFRDPSSFAHFMIAANSTASTDTDRIKIYLNGVLLTGYSTSNFPVINQEFDVNSLVGHYIGNSVNLAADFMGSMTDVFLVDGQALTPDVFGYYKKGDGYISAGSTQATDFKKGQWVPKAPKVIKSVINARGGFGVNGFYLPMNDDSNFGADFHCEPNSIIKLKGEDFNEYPQPRNGAPTTTDAYVSQLRDDSYKDYLVLAIPGIKGGRQSGYGDYSADIKGSGINKVMTAVGGAGVTDEPSFYGSALTFGGTGDYLDVGNDLDFNFGSGDFTVEYWQNVNSFSSTPGLGIWDDTNSQRSWAIYQNSSGYPRFYVNTDGTSGGSISVQVSEAMPTNQWTHFCMERNGSNLFGYVNGVCVGINTNIGTQSVFTPADSFLIGKWGTAFRIDGKIQDLRIYKGVAKYKGGFDVPKPYTPVGIGTWRAVPDTTANNFATLNGVYADYNSQNGSASYTLSNGNLTFLGTGNNDNQCGTIGVSTGKWYYEARLDNAPERSVSGWGCGISTTTANIGSINYFTVVGSRGDSSNLDLVNRGTIYADNAHSPSAGDIVAYALDLDSNPRTLTPYINGVGFATTSIIAPIETFYYPLIGDSSATDSTITVNFGQNPTFSGNVAAAGTFTDSNSKGLFKYKPPSGFLALCEDNLPTPAIKNPGEYFKTVLWTGDGAAGRSITGVGFTPDLVWMKSRNVGYSHHITDSVRGPTLALRSNGTNGDGWSTGEPGDLLSFDSDGFSIRQGFYDYNESGSTYVAWCWRAGAGTTTANTDGSINSVVSVNQDAGFSIVSYAGNGSESATVGHGLGKTPSMVIVKERDGTNSWSVKHSSLATNFVLLLDSTIGQTNATTAFTGGGVENLAQNTFGFVSGTSNADNVVESGKNYIAYCWAEIEGFSKFGSYVGNGSADGPFVYCGFKPAFVLIKNASTTGPYWSIADSSRQSTNPTDKLLFPNDSLVETQNSVYTNDLLSNGFKIRNTNNSHNTSGDTYIFAAFAESPFTTANAK